MGEFDWTSFIENLWDRENAQGKKGIEGKGGFRATYIQLLMGILTLVLVLT